MIMDIFDIAGENADEMIERLMEAVATRESVEVGQGSTEAGVAHLADGVVDIAVEVEAVAAPAVLHRTFHGGAPCRHLDLAHDAARVDSQRYETLVEAVVNTAPLEPSHDAASVCCGIGTVAAPNLMVALTIAIVHLASLIDSHNAANTCVAAHQGDGVAAVLDGAIVGVADAAEATLGGEHQRASRTAV